MPAGQDIDRHGKAPAAPRPGAQHRLTLVLDPRFPGGTAAAAASELAALQGRAALGVVGLDTAMLRGREVNPRLQAVLDALGLALDWEPRVIRGDTVVVHNPACLKFETGLGPRISCDALYVVTHENPLRPNGSEGFDVAACLALIERASVAGTRRLAPVSPANRASLTAWRAAAPAAAASWEVAAFDWFNVIDLPLAEPNPEPRDRRGRHSRPGLEKFPPLETMLAHFPSHAERTMILGADAWLVDPRPLPRHWQALPFGAMEVGRFLEEIDFFVYFTHPLWRESFGRVIAEAIAAGKLVITDPDTAAIFGPGVVASDGSDVDAIVARHVAAPDLYARRVREAQARLADFSPDAFRRDVASRILGAANADPARADAAPRPARRAASGRAHALL